MERKYVITIGRQLGSGGKQIGALLATQLNVSCYDKELIQIASKESGLGKEFFEQADEKSKFSLINGLFGLGSNYMGDIYTNNYLCNESLFKIQSDVIRKLAEQQSCIFFGRCADYILRDHAYSLNIFICADIQERMERITKSQDISSDKAKALIEQTDKKRAEYYNYYSNKVWGSATSYHVCINSSVLGIEKTADYIKQIALEKFSLI